MQKTIIFTDLDGTLLDLVRYSYEFFRRLYTLSGEIRHFKTGPTGTNVMDVQMLLICTLENATAI